MSALPSTRVTPSRAFLNTGLDYAGPFSFKQRSGRGQSVLKCYVALFVCFSTRAIHLELVSDLSTKAFLAALKRFIARRGKPQEISSDCGTNFVGANRELKDLHRQVLSIWKEDIYLNTIASEGIKWKFNPPAAPHFGGLWEAGVKSTKYHLRRVMGNSILTYEEFSTLLTQIEACLNSRPLSPLSSDPTDLNVLTPGHFLIGAPLTASPEPNLLPEPTNYLNRWQVVQQLLQHFWKRWSTEILSNLQQRPKWRTPQPNFKIGELILLKDNNLPPLCWKMGRITETFPGADGLIRVVTIKTSFGEFKRPITKICSLPTDPRLEHF